MIILEADIRTCDDGDGYFVKFLVEAPMKNVPTRKTNVSHITRDLGGVAVTSLCLTSETPARKGIWNGENVGENELMIRTECHSC